MSEKLGMVQYGENNEYVFLGREMIRSKDYSEQTAQEIDEEVKRIINDQYARSPRRSSRRTATNSRLIAKCLLEYETLEGTQVDEIIRTGKFAPPDRLRPPSSVRRRELRPAPRCRN